MTIIILANMVVVVVLVVSVSVLVLVLVFVLVTSTFNLFTRQRTLTIPTTNESSKPSTPLPPSVFLKYAYLPSTLPQGVYLVADKRYAIVSQIIVSRTPLLKLADSASTS